MSIELVLLKDTRVMLIVPLELVAVIVVNTDAGTNFVALYERIRLLQSAIKDAISQIYEFLYALSSYCILNLRSDIARRFEHALTC